MFGVDEGADAALLLPFRHRVQRQRGLARGLRPVDFDHAPPRQAADTQRNIEPERARRYRLDVHRAVVLAQLHHRALAELALDLGERGGQGLGLIHGGTFDDTQGSGGHSTCSLWRGFASGTNGRQQQKSCTTFVLCSQYVLFGGLHLTEVDLWHSLNRSGRHIPFDTNQACDRPQAHACCHGTDRLAIRPVHRRHAGAIGWRGQHPAVRDVASKTTVEKTDCTYPIRVI